MSNNNSGVYFIAGFLLGGFVGAAAGTLLAPKAGSEMRTDLRERRELWQSRAEHLAGRIREHAGPAVHDVRDRIGPAVEGLRERVGPVAGRVASRVRPVAPEPESERPEARAVAVEAVGQDIEEAV